MRKYDFINIKCPMCGKRELVPSYIEFTACYGSQYDMENAMLPICGDCFDRIYEGFMENVGAENMNIESGLYYFQLFGLEFEIASIYESAGRYTVGDHSAEPDRAFRKHFLEHVNICDDPALNRNRGLTKSWYQKAKPEDFERLKKDVSKYFCRYLRGVKAQDIMWTCPAEYEKKIKGKGYTRWHSLTREENNFPPAQREDIERKSSCFVPCNSRATNDFSNRWALAYLCNMWPNTMCWGFFVDNNISVNEKQYALSCLIQWVCRSRIRNGQPVYLYLPNSRMRSLLIDWMNG